MNPKVSVILPVYNEEEYLGQCLDSVLSQTLRDIEVICVDDGSSDRSMQILSEYAARDQRVRVVEQANAGAGAARNNGMGIARGDYLSFLDSDDFFEPTMLEKAYGKAEETGADFVVFRSDQYREDTGKYAQARWTLRMEQLAPYRPMNFRSFTGNVFKVFVGWPWDKLYRRSFVEENGLRFQVQRTSNDMLFVFSSVVLAKRIETVDEILAHQRRNNPNSLSNTREKSWTCFYEALKALKATLIERGLYFELERDFVNYALHFSLWNFNTISGPCREKLYNLLRDEVFETMGITSHEPGYFDDCREYAQYERIMAFDFDEYETDVSVVIPVYNAEAYLSQCLDSILEGQDGTSIEVICVDDCSTDSTPQVLEEYSQRYPGRFRHVRNEENVYAGRSRNRGLELARGRYVHFMDADDYVEPGAYSELVKIADENGLDWLKTKCDEFDDETGDPVKNPRYELSRIVRGFDGMLLDYDEYPNTFMEAFSVVPWNAIYRRRFLMAKGIRFNSLFCVNDRSFYIETCVKGERMMFARQCLVHHRSNAAGSLVTKRAKHFDCQFESYRLVKKICDESDASEELKFEILEHELFDIFMWYLPFCEEGGDAETAARLTEQIRGFLEEVDVGYYEAYGERSRWLQYRGYV